MKINEENFIKELEKGNSLAVEYIVDTYGALIKAVIMRNLHQYQSRWEECFNDVLLAVWKNPDSFSSKKSNFKNWLCAIAKYKAIDAFRRENTREYLNNAAEAAQGEEEVQSAVYIEKGFEAAEGADGELEKLLSCLTPEDKELFIRRYVKEQQVEQIAAETGMERNLIYSRISRGKKKIRRAMKEKGVKASE